MEHRIAQTCGVVGPQYKCVNGAWVLLSHADPADGDGGRGAEPAGTVAPLPMAARLAAAEQQTRDVEAKEALTRRNTANDVKGRIRAARAARLERQHARDRAKGGKVGGEPDLVPAAAALPPPHAAGSRDQGGGDHRAGSAGRGDTDLWLKQGGDWVAAKTSNTLDGTLLAGRPQLGPLAPLPPPCRVRSPQLRGRGATPSIPDFPVPPSGVTLLLLSEGLGLILSATRVHWLRGCACLSHTRGVLQGRPTSTTPRLCVSGRLGGVGDRFPGTTPRLT